MVLELALFCKGTMAWELEFINFGGGVGIAYSALTDIPLDIDMLSDQFRKLRVYTDTGIFYRASPSAAILFKD